MEESGGAEGFKGDEISLLAEELVQLSVKSSVWYQAKNQPCYAQYGRRNLIIQIASGHKSKVFGRQGRNLRLNWQDKIFF